MIDVERLRRKRSRSTRIACAGGEKERVKSSGTFRRLMSGVSVRFVGRAKAAVSE